MPIPPSPFVTFVFAGLFAILGHNPDKTSQVGFLTTAHGHEIQIVVYKIMNQTESEIITTMKFNHETIRDISDLSIDIEGPVIPKQQTVEKYMSIDFPTDRYDFRHIVNLEGPAFYGRVLKLKPDIFKPKLVFQKGLFFTSTLTEKEYKTIQVDDFGNPLLTPSYTSYNIGKVADKVGVNLYTDHPSQDVVIRKGKGGEVLIRLTQGDGVRYGILVQNIPKPDIPMGGHFLHYYDAVLLNPGERRITISQFGVSFLGSGGCVGTCFGNCGEAP